MVRDEFRFLRRPEAIARSGAAVPRRTIATEGRAARTRRRRTVCRRALARRWRRWAGSAPPSPSSTAAPAWATKACACWPRNSAVRWRRCRSLRPPISPPRRCCSPAATRRSGGCCRSWRTARRSAASRWPRARAIPIPPRVRARAIGGRLTGSKWPVMDGDIADFAIVVARDEAGEIALFLADLQPTVSPPRRSPPSIPAAITRASTLPAPRWSGSARRRAGRWCSVCSSARRSWSRSSRWAAPMPRSRWRATTHWSAMRSAGRSARSRRSSTSSPMCMSRSNWRGRMRITAPGHCRRMRPNCRWPRRPRGCRRPRRSIWHRRRTSRRTAASASPGTWTAICTIGARSSLRWRSGRAPWWKHRLVELLEMRNAA